MSKKIRKVPVNQHPQDSGPLSSEEARIILRGADDIIMEGGRSLLAKILKGFRDKKVIDIL